ncbi:hypothetical protein HYH03_013653 [Edaphochlamys debaryana]|uniref:Uncharacterized protein n=1 Tax=Edaphochlamys debaryana TaxID=47281 RepID=A0A836BUE1_9CHLO|nr:hypothetical protein HYH03_013653 [Edaphochlamys debaryana]|eukprot:KAG2487809.1 hypothetical protein HYH03_013653 [Edaphochlamys debaryana]
MAELKALPVVITPTPLHPLLDEVLEELQSIGDEGGWRMLSTKDSYPGQAIFQKRLRAVDRLLKVKKFPEAFTYSMALLAAAKAETFWTRTFPRRRKIAKKMKKHWAALWKQPLAELGGVSASDRKAVEGTLTALLEEMESCGPEL